jgi:hypothetical protein
VIANPLLRKSATVAYAAIRTPLALVENRLPESSGVRTGLQRALHTLDTSVAPLLHQQPEPRAERRDGSAPPPAATPPATPAQDIQAEQEAIAEAVRERQPDVGELADPNLDVAEVQARLQAKHAVELRLEAEENR